MIIINKRDITKIVDALKAKKQYTTEQKAYDLWKFYSNLNGLNWVEFEDWTQEKILVELRPLLN